MPTILIVDDDPLMSQMYRRIFTSEHYKVAMAEDGVEGLKCVREVKPTIILLDIMMPKMNGLDVLDTLKADQVFKRIPVIMLTDPAGEKDAETALMKGAVKYIIKKENEPKDVVRIVKEVITGNKRDENSNVH